MTPTLRLDRTAPSGDARLTVAGDPGRPPILIEGTITIGTDSSNVLVLDHPTVSRFHCAVERIGGVVEIVDRDSRNGTYVNGVRVASAAVTVGAKLQIGEITIALDFSGPAPTVQLVGESPPMLKLRSLIDRVAPTDATVLISGETGTGKTTVARLVHAASWRHAGPLEILDCGALPSSLVESELFGYERGAFTDALSGRPGAFERAHRGTLVLEEVCALSVDVQTKFLRGVEERRVRRLGAVAEVAIDVRLIATTSRNLVSEAAAGRFRRDLLYRLDVIRLSLPPLRDRTGDIPLIASELARRHGGPELNQDDLQALARSAWPGNVRELRAILERVAIMGDRTALRPAPGSVVHTRAEEDFRSAKQRIVSDFERNYVRDLLRTAGGNVSAAARIAGMDRNHLRSLIARHLSAGNPLNER